MFKFPSHITRIIYLFKWGFQIHRSFERSSVHIHGSVPAADGDTEEREVLDDG